MGSRPNSKKLLLINLKPNEQHNYSRPSYAGKPWLKVYKLDQDAVAKDNLGSANMRQTKQLHEFFKD